MMVSLVQWHAAIVIFNCQLLEMHKNFICNKFKVLATILECLFLCYHYLESFFSLLTILYMFLLRSHGDIKLNPGPCKSNDNNLSVCHWNLNSITAHNFSKLTQLKAYISTYKYDFICLSETYLDSSTPNNLIDIEGYTLIFFYKHTSETTLR